VYGLEIHYYILAEALLDDFLLNVPSAAVLHEYSSPVNAKSTS
jgi:hypothetical protein